MRIKDAFQASLTDKNGSHDYDIVYEKIFTDPPKSLLEVGVYKGHSLFAWATLFPYCELTGIDITDKRFDASVDASGAKIILYDSTDLGIRDLVSTYETIIDDGSHFYKDIISTFENLHDRFTKTYVIEDIMGKDCLDIITTKITELGYRYEVFESKTRRVRVNTNWIWHNVKKGKEYTVIDLYMVVAYKS